jgi:site-specific recombinase XerD
LSFLAEAKLVASRSPEGKESPYVFCNPKSGRAFTNIFNSWDKARERAGLKDVRMHDLRHSFASALVNNGLSIYDVKELLGHASINTTQRYAHLSQDRLAQATETVALHYGSESVEAK